MQVLPPACSKHLHSKAPFERESKTHTEVRAFANLRFSSVVSHSAWGELVSSCSSGYLSERKAYAAQMERLFLKIITAMESKRGQTFAW